MSTFTWKTSDGREVQVEPVLDVDEWTGREMRAAERLCGGTVEGSGFYTTLSLAAAIGIARTVPGHTVETADTELTFGRVRGILTEMREQEQAAASAAVAALPSEDGDVVLSPTRPDEPDDTPPPA